MNEFLNSPQGYIAVGLCACVLAWIYYKQKERYVQTGESEIDILKRLKEIVDTRNPNPKAVDFKFYTAQISEPKTEKLRQQTFYDTEYSLAAMLLEAKVKGFKIIRFSPASREEIDEYFSDKSSLVVE
jgi:hypothetical protein